MPFRYRNVGTLSYILSLPRSRHVSGGQEAFAVFVAFGILQNISSPDRAPLPAFPDGVRPASP